MPHIEYIEERERFEFCGDGRDPREAGTDTYTHRHIPKEAKWRWDGTAARWWAPTVEAAILLLNYAHGPERERLEALSQERDRRLAASRLSRAQTSDFSVPAPDGCEYLPFQLAGIQYCLTAPTGNALIGDDPGLGKTIEALGIINASPDIYTVVVVCPATVKVNWAREARKWLVHPPNVQIWQNSDHITPTLAPDGGVSIHILNWDILARRRPKDDLKPPWARTDVLSLHPDLLIMDEAHKAKNPRAQRTKAVQELAACSKRILALTGTPITNRPIELWPIIHILDPDEWHSYSKYQLEYCEAHHEQVSRYKTVWVNTGASNLGRLQTILRSRIMVRRKKEEVLTELPPKRRQVIEFDPTKYRFLLTREQDTVHQNQERVAELRKRLDSIDRTANAEQYRSAVDALNAEYRVAFTEISRVRHETALAKVGDVVAFCEDALEAEGKIILYGHHRDVVAQCAEALREYGVVTLTGSDSQTTRNDAIDRFQKDPAIRVFVGSTLAAGVGITLTAASTVIFAELDWAPANMSQAEDRCHRIGTVNAVNVYHLVVDESLDARMAHMLIEKQEIIDAALDDLTDDLTLKPFEVLQIKPVSTVDVFAFTEAERECLLYCVRFLSARCDGARTEDGMGFNKNHARIGHSLAAADALTDKQATIAVRIAHFYRGQFGSADRADIDRIYARWAHTPEESTYHG